MLLSPSAILYILVPPPPPANVTYSHVKETSVQIHWHPPELYEMFSIERYYITYSKYGAKNWSNKIINDQFTHTQLDNLESETLYIITIIAENANGRGRESKRIEIKSRKKEGILNNIVNYEQVLIKKNLKKKSFCRISSRNFLNFRFVASRT